uniref:Putative secreted protein n=1 Tax=Anopheles darlingi TaxID=43151 RepID=A0A2M4DDS0_ANODA
MTSTTAGCLVLSSFLSITASASFAMALSRVRKDVNLKSRKLISLSVPLRHSKEHEDRENGVGFSFFGLGFCSANGAAVDGVTGGLST